MVLNLFQTFNDPSELANLANSEFTVNPDGSVTVNTNLQASFQDAFSGTPDGDVASVTIFSSVPADTRLGSPNGPLAGPSYVFFRQYNYDGTPTLPQNSVGRVIADGPNGAILNVTGGALASGDILVAYGDGGFDILITPGFDLDQYVPSGGDVPTNGDLTNPQPVFPFTIAVGCLAAGTLVSTTRGPVPVEHLAAGDQIVTESGTARRAIWVGRTTIDLARHPNPASVAPVRIAAGAFGDGLPYRDLVLSPDHAVFVDGHLIPAKALVNDRTITRPDAATIAYFHVELETHDVILAEGLAVETYLDTGGRDAFDGGPVRQLHPTFAERTRDAALCAEMLVSGDVVEAIRARLARVADVERSAVFNQNEAA